MKKKLSEGRQSQDEQRLKKRKTKPVSAQVSSDALSDGKISDDIDALRQQNQKRAKVALLTVLISLAVLLILFFLPYDKILAALFPEKTVEEDIFFYPKDFETDILMDSE